MTELLYKQNQSRSVYVEATSDCYQRGIKSGKHKQKCLQLLGKVFKNVSYNIIRSTLKAKIKRMAQEFHAAVCDADLDLYKSVKVMRDRLDAQKLHNLPPPCRFCT